jgi:hypothetical protein
MSNLAHIRDRDPDRIAEYVQEREDVLDQTVEMLERAWAAAPETVTETVTKPSPVPETDQATSASD